MAFSWHNTFAIACLCKNIFYPQLPVIDIVLQLLRHYCSLGIVWPRHTLVISVEAGRTALLLTRWCWARVWKMKPPPSLLNGEQWLIAVSGVGINTQHFPSLMSCLSTVLMRKYVFAIPRIHRYTEDAHTSIFTLLTPTTLMGCVDAHVMPMWFSIP